MIVVSHNKMPLHYAILKLFADGEARCAQDIIDTLKPDYGSYKLLTREDVDETLATAKENGILDEVDCGFDADGPLKSYFKINEFGSDMIRRYL